MRAWFVRGGPGDASDALYAVLRQWAEQLENKSWKVDYVPGIAELAAALPIQAPDVLVLAEPSCPAGPWLGEALTQGIGLVAATSLAGADSYRVLAEQHAIQLMSLSPTVEAIELAMRNVLACLRRQRDCQARIDHLQQRLADRIIIERAKGILVERLGISEKEAYTRLRVSSRRQRRQIRDIAQALLDAHPLLLPEMNSFSSPPPHDHQPSSGPTLRGEET